MIIHIVLPNVARLFVQSGKKTVLVRALRTCQTKDALEVRRCQHVWLAHDRGSEARGVELDCGEHVVAEFLPVRIPVATACGKKRVFHSTYV